MIGCTNIFDVLKRSTSKTQKTTLVANDLHLVSERLNETLSGFVTAPEASIERSGSEKRETPRIENRIRVTVNLEQGGLQINGMPQDISMGGINLKCSQKLQKNTSLPIIIHLPLDERGETVEMLHLTGRIVREEKKQGIYHNGIQFSTLNSEQKQSLQTILDFFCKQHSYAGGRHTARKCLEGLFSSVICFLLQESWRKALSLFWYFHCCHFCFRLAAFGNKLRSVWGRQMDATY